MRKVKVFIVFLSTIAMIALLSIPYQGDTNNHPLEYRNQETIKVLEDNFEKVLINLEKQKKLKKQK